MGDFGSRGSSAPAAHPSAARRAAAPLRCAAPADANAKRRIARSRYRLDDPSRRSRSADPRHPGARPRRGANGQSQRRAQARRCERSLDPFPTVQRAPARQSSLDGVWGMGAIPTQQSLRLQAFGDVRQASHVGDRSPASTDPRDDAPRISTRAPPSPATAAAGRWRRPPRSPNRRDPTRAPAGCSRPYLRGEML